MKTLGNDMGKIGQKWNEYLIGVDMTGEKEKTRYFVLFYTWAGDNGNGVGHIHVKAKKFPSRKKSEEEIKKGSGYDSIITNIFEFKNKEDFDNFLEN